MKKLKLYIGANPVLSFDCVSVPVIEPVKMSDGANAPATGAIGDVESVSSQDGMVSFTLPGYKVNAGLVRPDWLLVGARVEVDFICSSIRLIKKSEIKGQ